MRLSGWELASDPRPGATLGVVSGRRRQGKSFLLESLCQATGGFYHEAIEGTETEALRNLGEKLSTHTGAPARLAFDGWASAIDALFTLGVGDQPHVVVLDELPYLINARSSLPSIIQAALTPRGVHRRCSRTRLVLCGSALSMMGKLLSGNAPLRGRAGLDLVVPSFDYREAARFWGLSSLPALAARVYAVVGGTPAYRREFVADDAPSDLQDFDAWVVRTLLNPACPLFREGRYLLAEEPDLRDTALYRSVLSAIAGGRTTNGAIAAALGRQPPEIGHPLRVLEDSGFIEKRDDAFRAKRPIYHIVEPVVRAYHAILRPHWSQLERPGRGMLVWERAQSTFRSVILGPAFEALCREWTLRFASADTFGGVISKVGAGQVHDPSMRTRHEIDVVGFPTRTGSISTS